METCFAVKAEEANLSAPSPGFDRCSDVHWVKSGETLPLATSGPSIVPLSAARLCVCVGACRASLKDLSRKGRVVLERGLVVEGWAVEGTGDQGPAGHDQREGVVTVPASDFKGQRGRAASVRDS